MKWTLSLIPILFFTILPVYADFHSEMIQFMPDTGNFESNWKFSQVQGFKDLKLDWSDETPNGLLQRFVYTDQVSETEMINTISIYDFEDKKTSSLIFDEYVTTLIANHYPKATVDNSLQENCFAAIINEGQYNEKTSIACTNSQYVIISTSEQSGDVFDQDKQLTTEIAANGFASILYQKLDTFKSIEIPTWIKNNASWWADGIISDKTFVSAVQFLINEKIIVIANIPESIQENQSNEIPTWIKNNARWWSSGEISDDDFVTGIQYLIEQGIIQIK